MKYTTINIQGNLLSEEILQKIESTEAQGQQTIDFGFEPGTNLRSEIEYAWSRIKLDWKHFTEKSQNLPASDPYGTTLSRKWMEQFFNSLGFNHTRQKSNLIGENNQGYNISHTVDNLDELPIHIVGFNEPDKPEKNTLDIKTSGGTSRLSPHATMQEYLNVTEHVFGIASNGLFLRLIRDSGRLIKLTYIEYDLKRMLDEDKYSEFTLLFRLLHASRFPRSKAEAEQCLLEKYYQDSIESGNRIRDGLSLAVKESLLALGIGFLQHEGNNALRVKIQNGTLTPKEFYRQLLRIIYRFLFLMVTEERDLVYDPDDKSDNTQRLKKIYWKFYSIARLRKLCENRYVYESQFNDLWHGLVQTFQLFEDGGKGKKIGIQPLAGDLFSDTAIKDLQECLINNKLLLECVRNLNEFRDDKKNLVHINYRSLDVEELGSVYEGLLELHPVIENIKAEKPAHINFTFHEGTDRKTTGSYYTRPELVNELIKSALIPVINERLNKHIGNKAAQAKALLKLKVCDAAAGSGHMLLAAARTIAWYLAKVQSGEENPAPSIYRQCLREVIQHCIYAVDYNPDAVELCKLALWLEGHSSGKPLSFLDHKIRNGNSLVGVSDLSVLQQPLPDEAFNPVTGDDKEVCKELKKRNAAYRKTKQTDLFSAQGQHIKKDTDSLKSVYAEMESIEQDTVEAVQEVKKRFGKVRECVFHEEKACHIWTAAFFKTYSSIEDPTNPSSEKIAQYFYAPTQYGRLVGEATKLAIEHKFFHWPLEFPDVFEQGGFDVMLGNPPWEILELKEQEFFATRDVVIASAENKAARTRLINVLKDRNPMLYIEYQNESHYYDAIRKFIKESGRNPLTAIGKINMYPIFAETFLNILNKTGNSGIIVPTGIATDDSNKGFFGTLIENNQLYSLFDFENKEAIFPNVHRSYKFSLLTISGSDIGKQKSKFGFFLTRIEHLQDKIRIFNLTKEDFLLLNPNTKTCPIFRTSIDANITMNIFHRIPILMNETLGHNKWTISFRQGLFNMASDSNLFKNKEDNLSEGRQLRGNVFIKDGIKYLPLYEGKMCVQYNHRACKTYFNSNNRIRPIQQDETSLLELEDAAFLSQPIYWVDESEVLNKIEKCNFLLGFRKVTGPSNERTVVTSIFPFSAAGDSMQLVIFDTKISKLLATCFCNNFSSLILDYLAKQKVGGVNLNFFYVQQLPFVNPENYCSSVQLEIIPNAIELIYSSWDIKAFADDVWKEADADLRAAIQQQWKANKTATGGHEWVPPEWCEIDPEGCPLPPFKWDEDRRAVLKAELDAIYAKLYGLTTEELRYILDPQDVYGPDFPGETFRVLKEKEIRLYGEYRTRRLVLEAWESLNKNNLY